MHNIFARPDKYLTIKNLPDFKGCSSSFTTIQDVYKKYSCCFKPTDEIRSLPVFGTKSFVNFPNITMTVL